jgi:putative ABC transport system permease protein
METLITDIRYAVRSLLKQPAFAFIALCTFALGIGANTALFSVVNGVLLNPLPFDRPEELVTLHQRKPNFETGAIPFPNFRDWQKENQTFSAMAISRGYGYSMIGLGEAERVSARLVTSDFFRVLGVKPALGRDFLPGEDEAGAIPVALISQSLWEKKFSSSADVIQKNVTLDDRSYSIVGVVPASFALWRNTDVYVPIGQWNNPALKTRSAALGLHGIGRLKPGVSLGQAEADLNRVMANLAEAYPETNKGNFAKLVSLRERVVGNIQPILLTLFGAVGFVLLIACVNVSNLILVRSAGRSRDFAICTALGASRWRLLQKSLTESVVLALAGGALGLLLATWGTSAALKALPSALPRADEIALDSRVLLFTFVVSFLLGILSGLVPALKATRSQLSETLKEGGRGASTVKYRSHSILVAVEIALALVLLIGAGLMVRSLANLSNVDPGFHADNVLTFGLTLSPSMASASPSTLRNTLRELNETIKTAPGVRSVSFSSGAVPLQGQDDLFFWLEGQPKPASQSEMSMAVVYVVEPEYLDVMGIPLKQGRFFTPQDDERSTPVVVIDEALARKHFGNENPIGKRLYFSLEDQQPSQIVGVVGHVKQWSLAADDEGSLQSQLYIPFRSLNDDSLPASAGVLVRHDGDSENIGPLIGTIRSAVTRQNKQNVISGTQTMNEVIAGTLSDRRFSMVLLGAFAAVALLLASLGIYGVISYLVGQRTHELGIRIALGAQSKDVLRLVLNQGLKMALAGWVLGMMASFGLTRLLTRMLFGVSTTDPTTFVIISLLLMIVALLACYIPARRATKVDPLVALRYE